MNWQTIIDELGDNGTELYVAVVLLLGATTLVRVLRSLTATKRLRKQKLIARERMDAVATDSPVDNPNERAQDLGLDSIERNATVSRRLLVPLIILGTTALAIVPLLSRVPATMISMVVAIATVVLGVAARPLIENAMSGLVMSSSQLVNIGDTVRIEDKYGTIEDISTTHTTIKLWDWRRYVVPNGRMIQQTFLNYSVHDKYEWTYIAFTVSYEVPLERARELALAIPRQSKHFAEHEDPQFWVMDMGPQGYEAWLVAWADTPSAAWMLRSDMREKLIMAFQEHEIPVQRMRHEVFSVAGQPQAPTDDSSRVSSPEARA